MRDNEDIFEIDDEFAKSLEKLVAEETNVAKAYISNDELSADGSAKEQHSGKNAGTVALDLGATQLFNSEDIKKNVNRVLRDDAISESEGSEILLDAPVTRKQSQTGTTKQGQTGSIKQSQTGTIRQNQTGTIRQSQNRTVSQSGAQRQHTGTINLQGVDIGTDEAASEQFSPKGVSQNTQTRVASARALERQKEQKRNKMIIAGVIAFVAVVVIGIIVAAVVIQKKNKSSYEYNLEHGMKAYESTDYTAAKDYLNRAYETSEGKKDVDLMYALYDCYNRSNDTVMAEKVLQDMISFDKYNEKALKALAQLYRDNKNGAALNELFKKYRDTNGEKYLQAYEVSKPTTSEKEGTFSEKVKIKLIAASECDIYYTTDGSEPSITSSKFSDDIVIEQGTVTIKAVAVDSIGVMSSVAEYTFKIDYTQPEGPVFDITDNEIDTDTVIHITNIGDNDKVYYTIDGTTPTTESTMYVEGIQLQEGTYVVAAVIYNNGGASKIVRQSYTVKKAKIYTYEECVKILKERMISLNILSSTGLTTTDGNKASFYYQARKTVDGTDMYIIKYTVTASSAEETKGYYGVGLKTSQCYKVTIDGDEFTAVKY